ncbi:MAG: hypothetical protein RB191_04570 [Terriglobia bacterium]|nr:hypothetical protein [Terriglobia bacterium]
MTICHVIHGIHSGTPSAIQPLIPYLRTAGFDCRYPDYGYVLGIETKLGNPMIVGSIFPYVGPDDILIGHSNGCAIAYDILQRGAKVTGAVFINAALEQDFKPLAPWTDVYYNSGDDITEAAKIAATIGYSDPIWGECGHAGYLGKDPSITNINCGATPGLPVVSGHSDFFTPSKLAAWAPYLIDRIHAHAAKKLHAEAYA